MRLFIVSQYISVKVYPYDVDIKMIEFVTRPFVVRIYAHAST